MKMKLAIMAIKVQKRFQIFVERYQKGFQRQNQKDLKKMTSFWTKLEGKILPNSSACALQSQTTSAGLI